MSDRDRIGAARWRIRGVLVETALVGEPPLPGEDVPAGLRVKLELLQTSGSLWFRGAMHSLALKLGSVPAQVAGGSYRQALAAVVAGRLQRVPTTVVIQRSELEQTGHRDLLMAARPEQVEEFDDADAVAARIAELSAAGMSEAAAPGEEDYDLGLATLGLELSQELGSDVERLLLQDEALIAPLARGFEAGERKVEIRRVAEGPRSGAELKALTRSLRLGLRVVAEAQELHALAQGLSSDEPCCVLLGE